MPGSAGEKETFSQARHDVFPDDVRASPGEYKSTVILWSSIVRSVDVTGAGVTITFEHHYWDFIEDFSIQKAIAFLSPRGEGLFVATFSSSTKISVGDTDADATQLSKGRYTELRLAIGIGGVRDRKRGARYPPVLRVGVHGKPGTNSSVLVAKLPVKNRLDV